MRKSDMFQLILLLQAALTLAIDNGIGLTPPRGWRSWNAFDCLEDKTIITQAHMHAQMVAAVDKSRMVDGKPTSLADLGFDWISMDDGWQQCNCSVRQDLDPSLPKCDGDLCFGGHCSWHDKDGNPLVRKSRFPDMKALVDFGHSLGLKVGTYLNTCICNEHGPQHYEQDVKWMMDMGFDGVKIDNCGDSQNVSRWAELFNKTGKPIRIENCHNSWPDFNTGFCPMNFYRSGGDIGADINSILGEAYATILAADLHEPRSHPGCWAYPDMSEVGNFQPGPLQQDQEQTHWALWSIISSPLVLGFDMNDTANLDRVWPIITNRDALSVSEAWAGHPGTMIRAYPSNDQGFQMVQGDCDGSQSTLGWRFDNGKLIAPDPGGIPVPQCLKPPSQAACPPPTTYFSDVQCGLMLGNCTDEQSSYTYVSNTIQWSDGNPKDKPQCLTAALANFDITKDYFTRQAALVHMESCPQSSGSLAAAVSPAAAKAHAFDPSSECELTKQVHELHAAGDTTVPTAGRSLAELSLNQPSQVLFNLTSKGELVTAAGKCLRAELVSGVQLWAKPLSASSVAILLVNPSAEPETLSFPLADVPRRFTGSGQAGVNFQCLPQKCTARDVWAKKDTAVTSDHLSVSLRPWESAFYILLSSQGSDSRHESLLLSI